MENNKPYVLFVSRWYPHPEDPMFGLFVQRHAEAVSYYCKVNVLFAYPTDDQNQTYGLSTNNHNDITEILVSYKRAKSVIPGLGPIINVSRHLKALKLGYNKLLQTNPHPDISHVNILTRTGIFALYLKLKYEIPYIITEHWSRYLPSNPSYSGFLRKLGTKITVKGAAAITTVSSLLQKAMKEKGLHNKRWEIIPNVVSDEFLKASLKSCNNKKAQILHISCFEDASKNISGILRAISKLKLQRTDFHLTLVGDGIDSDKIKTDAHKLGLNNEIITFTGVLDRSDLIKQIQKSDFFVLFSNYETFAVVIPESMALGLPVVASRVGAIPEVLPDDAGILVEKGSDEDLAKAISNMIDDHHKYTPEKLRSHVREHYTEKAVGAQFYNIYNSILGK